DQEDVPVGIPGMGRRVVGFQGDRFGQVLTRLYERVMLHAPHQRYGAQHQVVGGGADGAAAAAAPCFDQQDFRIDLRNDLGGDLILQRQQVVGFAIETSSPNDLVVGAEV